MSKWEDRQRTLLDRQNMEGETSKDKLKDGQLMTERYLSIH